MTQIYITQSDLERLQQLLNKQSTPSEYNKALAAELSRAVVLEPSAIRSDVITMNSQVAFTDEQGRSGQYSLVYPEDADITQNKLSILSPIGCSLIGYKVGDTITIPTPGGEKRLTIEAVIYQPERSGDIEL